MALSDHVSLTITLDSVGIARAGFGLPMILSHEAPWADRIRFYTSLTGMVTDGFTTKSPEYRAAQAMFAQTPKPARIAVGRASSSVTQVYTVSVPSARNSEVYTVSVEGEGFTAADTTYTSDSASTPAEIHNGLVTALNAVTSKNYLAAFAALPVLTPFTFTCDHLVPHLHAVAHGKVTGDGPIRLTTSSALPTGLLVATDYWFVKIDADNFQLASSLANALAGTVVATTTNDGTGTQTATPQAGAKSPALAFTVTGSSANTWFSLKVYDPEALAIAQTHTVGDLAGDLTAILKASSAWYEVTTNYNSKAYVLAVALWTESNERIYVFDTQDTVSITSTYDPNSSTDTLAALMLLGYARTMGAYHPRPAAMLAAAWMGRWLPTDPGKATTKFKTLSGVEAVSITDTFRVNLTDRRANTYQTVAQRNITWEGTVPSTTYRFLDVVRNLDWVDDDVTKSVFGDMAGQDIVPYDEAGIATVQNAVLGSCQRAIRQGIFAANPAPVVVAPNLEDVSDTDKEDRVLRGVSFSATLSGAVHTAILDGTVTF